MGSIIEYSAGLIQVGDLSKSSSISPNIVSRADRCIIMTGLICGSNSLLKVQYQPRHSDNWLLGCHATYYNLDEEPFAHTRQAQSTVSVCPEAIQIDAVRDITLAIPLPFGASIVGIQGATHTPHGNHGSLGSLQKTITITYSATH